MHPERAARFLASFGAFLLILAASLRLLSVYLLASDPRLQPTGSAIPGPQPSLGQYVFSSDGSLVSFVSGLFHDGQWSGNSYIYSLDQLRMGNLPITPSLYTLDGMVYLNATGAGPAVALSPADVPVQNPVQAADGQALAFVDCSTPSKCRLYAIRGTRPAALIVEAPFLREMAWSTGNTQLAYVASPDGEENLYLYDFSTQQSTQLTHNGLTIYQPVFSHNGRWIAFLASTTIRGQESLLATPTWPDFRPDEPPAASGADVYMVQTTGQGLRQITDTPADEFSLAWTNTDEAAFSVWQSPWAAVAYLYAADPETDQIHRLYPETAIDSLTCTPALPGGKHARVKVTLSNTGSQRLSVPLEISVDRQPLDLITNRSAHRVHREAIQLQPGESQTVDWVVEIPIDIRVYLAASIETGVEFPISASFCQITPRSLYLPRLPLLGPTLALGVIGALLWVPWLRHTRQVGLWILGGSFWVLLMGIIALECWILLV